MCAAGGNKILVSALHYTLINLLLLSHPESCWETRPDSAMPGQAVSPSGCWHRSNRPDKKKTQLRRPDTGRLSTQLSRRTHTHTHTHPLRFTLSIQSPALWHTPHIDRQDSCQLSSHHVAARRDCSAELASLLHPKCTPPLSFQLIKWFTIPVFLCITEMVSSHPISWRRLGECSCVYSNKRSMWR